MPLSCLTLCPSHIIMISFFALGLFVGSWSAKSCRRSGPLPCSTWKAVCTPSPPFFIIFFLSRIFQSFFSILSLFPIFGVDVDVFFVLRAHAHDRALSEGSARIRLYMDHQLSHVNGFRESPPPSLFIIKIVQSFLSLCLSLSLSVSL